MPPPTRLRTRPSWRCVRNLPGSSEANVRDVTASGSDPDARGTRSDEPDSSRSTEPLQPPPHSIDAPGDGARIETAGDGTMHGMSTTPASTDDTKPDHP